MSFWTYYTGDTPPDGVGYNSRSCVNERFIADKAGEHIKAVMIHSRENNHQMIPLIKSRSLNHIWEGAGVSGSSVEYDAAGVGRRKYHLVAYDSGRPWAPIILCGKETAISFIWEDDIECVQTLEWFGKYVEPVVPEWFGKYVEPVVPESNQQNKRGGTAE